MSSPTKKAAKSQSSRKTAYNSVRKDQITLASAMPAGALGGDPRKAGVTSKASKIIKT